jgi:hypothetical protein
MNLISFLSPGEVYNRRQVCASCENNKLGLCIKCGCIILAKTKLASAQCPLNKWSLVSTDSLVAEEESKKGGCRVCGS